MFMVALSVLSGSGAATEAPLYLPWGGGTMLYTLQGQNQGSHSSFYSRYAYDFAPGPLDGTSFAVRAARDGRVTEVVEGFGSSADCDPNASNKDNYVIIDHGDGIGSLYSHLAQNSVIPQVGEYVSRGAPIARSDWTGYVCGISHLHYTAIDIKSRGSIDRPFADSDVQRHGGRPRTGEWYVSENFQGPVFRAYLPIIRRSTTR